MLAFGVKVASGSPGPAHRIVQFCARGSVVISILSPCDEDRAVWQQSRRVRIASCVEVARENPGPGRRIVQFRGRRSSCVDI